MSAFDFIRHWHNVPLRNIYFRYVETRALTEYVCISVNSSWQAIYKKLQRIEGTARWIVDPTQEKNALRASCLTVSATIATNCMNYSSEFELPARGCCLCNPMETQVYNCTVKCSAFESFSGKMRIIDYRNGKNGQFVTLRTTEIFSGLQFIETCNIFRRVFLNESSLSCSLLYREFHSISCNLIS